MAEARTHRVLLVEDDPLDAIQIERTLARAKGTARFELDRVASLREAIDYLSQRKPDVIALDLSLPDANGLDTFLRVAEHAKGVAIVALTGNDDDDVAVRLLQHGAQDYLTKASFSPHEVSRCLDFAIQRVRLENTLEEARAHADATARAKEAFLATASHEIRTPLNAILGMAELLRATSLDADQRKYVEVFSRASHGLRDLLDNVLELARLGAGNVELRDDAFELATLLGDTAEVFAFQAHRKGLSVVVDLEPGSEGEWRGDPTRIRQVLANLLGNATKFTERGGIHVAARRWEDASGSGLRIDVRDTGPGIPPDRLESVFERFAQASPGVFARHGGTGLGLALCRELVARMGGRISARNQAAGGAELSVELPLTRSASPSAVAPTVLTGQQLLLVDDDPLERGCYAVWLRRSGAEVVEADTTADARHQLGQRRFSALIVDSRMPGEGGLELLESMRGRPELPARRVVMMMMSHRAGDLGRCAALDAAAVYKPLRSDLLIEAIAGGGRPVDAVTAEALPAVRILAAEDSEDNQLLLRSHLRGTDAALRIVANGREAAEAFESEPFDLVLMDLAMPELDGHQATRRIRAWEREHQRVRTPIVALSAHAFAEAVRASREAGCDGHVTKPFDREMLFSTIRHHVASRPRAQAIERALEPEIADLVPEYLARRARDVETLRACLAGGDLAEARTLGHRMKGSGGGYGMPRVSEIGAAIEAAAARGDAEALATGIEHLAQFLATRETVELVSPASPGAGTSPALGG